MMIILYNNFFIYKNDDIIKIIMNNGFLSLIIGPMFSGKTTRLLNLIDKLKIIDKKILVVKHVFDTRYNFSYITNHN
jgi:thymidine kinase